MFFRLLLCAILATMGLSGCSMFDTEKKKADAEVKKKKEEKKDPALDVSNDPSFQSFLGRLRTAVAKRDRRELAEALAPGFGYRWDQGPEGETPFDYWDKNSAWGDLGTVLATKFVPHEGYMVAPPQFATDASYHGYRVGLRQFNGSWKMAYFVTGQDIIPVSLEAPRHPEELGLPHREPFRFVDWVLELAPGESALCTKIFAPEDPVFRGHFPGQPLVPGVLLAEALAQTAGLAAGRAGRPMLLSAIRCLKFPASALPGETITLRARKLTTVGALWQFEVKAEVAGRAVAEGQVVLSEG